MTRSPDDAEDIAYEMDRELGNAEQREINRRVQWAREQKARQLADEYDHEPCCDHRNMEYGNCTDCLNTGHAHAPENPRTHGGEES